jgi:hypothetical protein
MGGGRGSTLENFGKKYLNFIQKIHTLEEILTISDKNRIFSENLKNEHFY